MKIINQSRELNKVDVYKLTKERGRAQVSKHRGEIIQVSDWIYYTDDPMQSGDEERETLSFMDASTGDVFTTISPTFIRTFFEIIDLEIDKPTILIDSDTTSKGREFFFARLHYSI